MSRINYNTTRNKERSTIPSLPRYKLKDKTINKLLKNKHLYNSWESTFYQSLVQRNYKIVSEKQWKIIQKLLNKSNLNIFVKKK